MTRVVRALSGVVLVAVMATVVEAQAIRAIPVRVSALVAEPVSGRLYGATPPNAPTGANSIIAIDPVAGTAGTPVFVGSNPRVLAPSSDGQFLYVGLGGASAIRRFDIGSGTAGPLIPLVRAGVFDDVQFARFILPVAGSPRTIVVGQSTRNPSVAESLVVYDDGVARPSQLQIYAESVVALDATTLLVSSSSQITRVRIDASGLSVASSRYVFPSPPRFLSAAGGLVYAEFGAVYDAATIDVLRVFRGGTLFPSTALAAPAQGRYFRITDGALVTHDLETFDIMDVQPLPAAFGVPSAPIALGGGLAYFTDRPNVVLVGDFAAPPPAPPPHPMPTARVDLLGCTDCRAGDAFHAAVTFTNPSAAPVRAEVKGRIFRSPTEIPLFGAPHGEITVGPGTQTVTVLQAIVPPVGVSGDWTMEITLLDPVSGRTYSTSYRMFHIY